MFRLLLMEIIGTFFLALVVALSGNAFAAGFILMVMVYAGGHISGAHYNPAVTLALYIRKACAGAVVLPYMCAQIFGAFLAALATRAFTGHAITPAPSPSVNIFAAGFAEMAFAFALCYVVLATATSPKLKGNHIYGLSIGLTLATSALAIGPISGCFINPSLAMGPLLYNLIFFSSLEASVWIYLLFPILGGIAAALVFRYIEKIH